MSKCPFHDCCNEQSRMCATLADCERHYDAVLALYPPWTPVIRMSTGETYVRFE